MLHKGLMIHLLDIFAVHPFQLGIIKYCRGFRHPVIIKFLHQLFQRKDLILALRAPAKQRHKIDNGLRHKALIDQILVGGMTAAFGKLVMLLVCDQRTMNVYRHLPSKGIIKSVILRRRGKVFISAYNMGNAHQMVIYNVCKVIGRIAVRFDQDHIVQLGILYRDISVNLIMEGCGSLRRIVLTDYIRDPCCQLCFYLFFG